jgi:hypothetical protein
MNLLRALSFCLVACTAGAFEVEDFFDRLDNALTIAALEANFRARLSGTIDLEVYHFQQPAPGLIDSNIDNLFNERLTLFLDAQFGSQTYFFAESRVDREFDPSNHGVQVRLDEYALRLTPWDDGRFNFRGPTVVGNWVPGICRENRSSMHRWFTASLPATKRRLPLNFWQFDTKNRSTRWGRAASGISV